MSPETPQVLARRKKPLTGFKFTLQSCLKHKPSRLQDAPPEHVKLTALPFPLFLLCTSTPRCPPTRNIAWWNKKKNTTWQHFDLGRSSGLAPILFHPFFFTYSPPPLISFYSSVNKVPCVGGWTIPVVRKQKFWGPPKILQSYLS